LLPRERAPDTHLIEGWVGSRVGLAAVAKKKFFHLPCWKMIAGHPACSLVSICTDVQLKLFIGLIKHHDVKMCEGVEVKFHAFLNLALHKVSG
jgi:hypothetical protein